MIDQGNFSRRKASRNDSIACILLKTVDKQEQFALMYSQESGLLGSIYQAALLNEDYEICQVIKELLEGRKIATSNTASRPLETY